MSELVTVTMPRLGESVAEGTLVKWLVAPGAKVTSFDVIAEIDTDKVSAEIPSPVTGIVRELLASEGDAIKVGADIAVIEAAQPSVPLGAPTPAAGSPAPGRPLPSEGEWNATPEQRHHYSPAVRELAKENNLDLAAVIGTGTEGRVTRVDVMHAIEARRAATRTAATPHGAPSPSSDGDEIVPLTRMRRLIAENMTLSKTTIPHAWQSQEVDMSGVVANRKANKDRLEREEGFPLTFLPYVVAAAAATLRAHPYANATFRPDGILLHSAINIAVAVGLEEGVIVPVIRSADAMSLIALARAINDLTTRARTKKLTADDLSGATFTVNNSGTFGTTLSYSVISPGQAGILTMGAIKERVVAIEGRIAIKPMMFLSYSLDHRVLDGLGAARFLSACREWLERVQGSTA